MFFGRASMDPNMCCNTHSSTNWYQWVSSSHPMPTSQANMTFRVKLCMATSWFKGFSKRYAMMQSMSRFNWYIGFLAFLVTSLA